MPSKYVGKPPASLGARASRPHKGWYSRGYLPHFDQPGLVQMITFRLNDALPTAKRAEWEELLKIKNEVKRRKEIEAYLDGGHGSCSLRDQRIAQLMEETLLHFDGQRYHLLAWVIMPNHVHVLIETFLHHSLVEVLHSWKSFTAKEANAILKRNGTFWQPEYFDRAIRDEQHLANAIRYIHNNPVKAKLVRRAEEWPYSSASRRNAGETPALPGVGIDRT